MLLKYTSFFLLLVFFSGCTKKPKQNNSEWLNVQTVDEIWDKYPERLRPLFAALDCQQAALGSICSKLGDKDTIAAAERLLEYFQKLDRSWVVNTLESPSTTEALRQANALLLDSVTIQDHTVKVPILQNGGWQWNFIGPEKDDEFGYSLNGLKYLPALLVAWQETAEHAYPAFFDRRVKDWIIHHPLPEAGDSIYMILDPAIPLDYRDIGEVEWRTLEAGHRLGASWPQLFFAFQKSSAFSPATRLLMLASICEQAIYLRQYHKSGHNWTTMEMNGLALAGLAFPEFKAAEDWANYALDVMSKEINRQVYPDGIQTEVSTKTQWVALRRFESVADHFQKADRVIAESYLQRLEEMYNYLAYSMRPDGHQPLNNDSDREDLRERVLKASEKFARPDWVWIATNGKSGTPPESKPSVTFPWAGIHIMRNNWEEQAHWTFFDTGPYGTGHQHRDKLHVSIAAYGKDLLVDGGRYTHQDYFSFDPAIWRGYFRSSFSHNVILVDGKGQNGGPTRGKEALIEGSDYIHHPAYDYAYGIFQDGYEGVEGKAVHSRSVLYLHDKFWVVLDHFETDRPRDLQVLWHYAPDCQVSLGNKEAVSNNPTEANLRIMPLGDIEWETQIVSGQEKPFFQGWYSANYGAKVPNPTVIYSTSIDQSTTFAWLIVAKEGGVPSIPVQFTKGKGVVQINLTEKNKPPVYISLPTSKNPTKVKVVF